MHLPGHTAIALTQHRLLEMLDDAPPVPLFVAAFFPDLVDKVIRVTLHAYPNGRNVAHNVFALAGTTLLVWLLWGRAWSVAWFMGYLGHLLADTHSMVPWLFPVRRYPFYATPIRFKLRRFIIELLLLIPAIIFYRR